METETDKQRRRLMLAALATVPLVKTSALASDQKRSVAESRTVELDAKPQPIAIDAARTAVIVIDMQNDFGSKGGMFDLAGIDITGIQNVVAPIARVL